jgi:uncharacterized iron-regulated membrane protein
VPRSVESTDGVRLTGDDLRTALERAYPDHRITEIREPQRPERPVFVALERASATDERLFDPYRGVDLGQSFPPILRFEEWLVRLHDDLLAGRVGRVANGIGASLMLILLATGAVIWWPGRAEWRQSLLMASRRRRFSWRLHSFVGFWTFALLAVWALTGVYFAFPEPFEATIDFFDSDLDDLERPGEAVLLALIKLHFGRFGGLPVRILWTVLGLLPALLFVTGFMMWWRRVLRPRWSAVRSETRRPLGLEPLSDPTAVRGVAGE